MDLTSVTLRIKAPNQQFEDQTVECDLSWNINQLKEYLSKVYPSKPKTDEQKLIYSGRILKDEVVLKDVLRQYEEEQIHTVHLVYTPAQRPVKPNENKNRETITRTANDNWNQRFLPSSLGGSGEFTSPLNSDLNNMSAFNINNMMTASPNMNTVSPEYQAAMQNWMLQQWNQFYNYYAGLIANGTLPNAPVYSYPPNLSSNLMPLPTNNQSNTPSAVNTERPATEENQINENPVPQRRFPLVVEEPENRDWLETIYIIGRLVLLSMLIYFYSTPTRCFLVIIPASLIYLYHIGFFRPAQDDNNNVNNNNNNNNNVNRQNAPDRRNEADAVDDGANEPLLERNDGQNQENEQGAVLEERTETVAVQNERSVSSTIAFLRTLILSFIASLMPDAQAL